MAGKELRCIMAPLTDGYVLLPNSAVAEVLNYSSPEPFKNKPAWLLGEIAWRGWQVPVVSFEQLVNDGQSNAVTSKARILIIKTLGESTQVNYIGLVIRGLPRLKKITADNLNEKQGDDLPEVVFSEISIDELQAIIPELGNLTRIVEQAAYDN